MDKLTYNAILEAALLIYDGMSEETITTKYGINSQLVKIGKKIHDKLVSIKIKPKFTPIN